MDDPNNEDEQEIQGALVVNTYKQNSGEFPVGLMAGDRTAGCAPQRSGFLKPKMSMMSSSKLGISGLVDTAENVLDDERSSS